ncbi:MAG: hypothetical protein Q7S34_00105 [bacterium]|nr:hypothetical protein [bacterium]
MNKSKHKSSRISDKSAAQRIEEMQQWYKGALRNGATEEVLGAVKKHLEALWLPSRSGRGVEIMSVASAGRLLFALDEMIAVSLHARNKCYPPFFDSILAARFHTAQHYFEPADKNRSTVYNNEFSSVMWELVSASARKPDLPNILATESDEEYRVQISLVRHVLSELKRNIGISICESCVSAHGQEDQIIALLRIIVLMNSNGDLFPRIRGSILQDLGNIMGMDAPRQENGWTIEQRDLMRIKRLVAKTIECLG